MGMEAEARLRAQADRLTALSEELVSRAAAFEAADQETQLAFGRLSQLLQDNIEEIKPILSPYVISASFPYFPIGSEANNFQHWWMTASEGKQDCNLPPPPPPDFTPPYYDVPPHIEMPGRDDLASRDQLLFWAWANGLYRNGRPDIDDYFNPFFQQNAVTGKISTVPSQTYMDAARTLYNHEGDLDELVLRNRDNPLNDWTTNPIRTLTGDEKEEVASVMTGWQYQTTIMLFIDEVKADKGLAWNYEPVWVYSMMKQHPQILLRAQWNFLYIYAEDPDNWDLLQQADLAGTE